MTVIKTTDRVVLWHCLGHSEPVRWRDDRVEGEVTFKTTGPFAREVTRKGWVRDPANPGRYFDRKPRPSRCPECGARGNYRVVKARTTSTLCDSRCTMAVSPGCDCSCGGRNHGIELMRGAAS